MVSLLPLILQGAGLGLSACLSPGPLFLYLISQSLIGGWKRGVLVAIAPLVSDIPLILVILALLNRIPALFLRLISLLGGVYVIYLAWKLFRSWQSLDISHVETNQDIPRSLLRAVLVNYSSPGPYMFWSLVNGPLLMVALRTSILHGIVFLLSFYGLFVGGMLVLAGIVSQTRRLAPRTVRLVALASVIILGIFGCILIYRSLVGEF